MNWTELKSEEQINQIREESKTQPVLIFKHSTRCAISRATLNRMERNSTLETIKAYYLDLISYRNISNQIADSFGIEHESPQVLIIQDGKPVYVRSHLAINVDDIQRAALAKN